MQITKYKETAAPGWVVAVYSDGTKSASFTDRGEIGRMMWADYQAWLNAGNVPEEYQTPEEKKEDVALLKQAQLDNVLNESINMRLGLEIQGDEQALEKAQDWYVQKVAEIESEYA